MGGEQPYYDPEDDPLKDEQAREEAAPLGEEETPPDEARILPDYEDHDMPTRQIARLDPARLDETQVASSTPGEAPLTNEDLFPPGFDAQAADDTVLNPAYAPRADDTTRAAPPPGRPPGAQTVPPTRSYTDRPITAPPAPPPPPVYGGFEDRPAVDGPPLPENRSRRRRTARERRDSGLYFPWWSLLVLLGGVALVATLLVVGLGSLGGRFIPGGETPVIIVVTSSPTRPPTEPPVSPTPRLPTATPTSMLATQETPAAALGETPDSGITPAPEQLAIRLGAEIEVFDVETAGLNVRGGAGTGFPVVLIAAEGTRFEVISGPEEADGFTWWQLRSVEDPTIEGWGVADYLRIPRE